MSVVHISTAYMLRSRTYMLRSSLQLNALYSEMVHFDSRSSVYFLVLFLILNQ